MKYLCKSQIDFGTLIPLTIATILFVLLFVSFFSEVVSIVFIVLLGIFLLYNLFKSEIFIFYFSIDDIKVKSYFKINNRINIINYESIDSINYLANSGFRMPLIELVLQLDDSLKHKKKYSFTHRSFNKRKEILLLLHSKGIPIYVDSFLKKDVLIFKGLDNVTFKDDYWIKNG